MSGTSQSSEIWNVTSSQPVTSNEIRGTLSGFAKNGVNVF